MGTPTSAGLYGYVASDQISLHTAMVDGRLHEVRSSFYDVANFDWGAPVYSDMFIRTAAGKRTYMFMRFQSKGELLFRFYQAPTLTGGLEDLAYPVNLASAKTATTRFFKNDIISPINVTAPGIVRVNEEYLHPDQGPMVPGAIGDPLTPTYILDESTDYLIRLGNRSGVKLDMQCIISFYEEDI